MGHRHGVYLQKGSQQVFTWGENTFGQTGNLYTMNSIKPDWEKLDQ